MAFKADTMDVDLASAVQKEMTIMVQGEEKLREKIRKMVSSSYLNAPLCLSLLTKFIDGRM